MACMASYPFAVILRDAVELMPKQISQGVFEGNYKKALAYQWSNENGSNMLAGVYKRYVYKNFPWMFCVS